MIDFVITWVDGGDPVWREDFKAHTPFDVGEDSFSDARFRDLGTLKYVLRGIDKHAPWVNKIHFVTYGHLPDWLNLNHPKLNIVKHDDIFLNKKQLPVFNSNAIEVNFLNINGLAEQFVVFNDDTLLLKDMEKDAFFQNGLPCDFLIENAPKGFLVSNIYSNNTWVKNLEYVVNLINREHVKSRSFLSVVKGLFFDPYTLTDRLLNAVSSIFQRYTFFEHFHHPQPHLLSNWREVSELFSKEVNYTSSSRFRNAESVTQYIFRYWHLVTGRFYPVKKDGAFSVNILSKRAAIRAVFLMKKANFLCVNDVPELSSSEFLECRKIILDGLEAVMPDKSLFEK